MAGWDEKGRLLLQFEWIDSLFNRTLPFSINKNSQCSCCALFQFNSTTERFRIVNRWKYRQNNRNRRENMQRFNVFSSALSTFSNNLRISRSHGIPHFLTIQKTDSCSCLCQPDTRGLTAVIVTLYIDFELFQCYCHICAVIKLHALLCCAGQKIHCSFSCPSLFPLFFLCWIYF